MLIKTAVDIAYSEVTPKDVYINRRRFLAGLPAAFLGARALVAGTPLTTTKSAFSTAEKQNTYKEVTNYNNLSSAPIRRASRATSRNSRCRRTGSFRWKVKWPSRANTVWTKS